MKKTFLNKRIPSFLGLLFLAISVVMVSWFGKSYTQLRSKASIGETPNSVQISNITDISFTVSYTTQEQVIGVISYGRDLKLGQVALDDRDTEVGLPAGQAGNPSARRVHHITISDLDPGTKYYFSIQSGSMELLNNKEPYEVTTAKELSEIAPDQVSVTGSVNFPDGTIPMDGVVYLSTSASQLFSIPSKLDGTYHLSVNFLRTSDLTSYVVLEKDTILQMTIKNAVSQSLVTVKAMRANPIPPVTLSKDYDFTINSSSASLTASESADISLNAYPSGFPVFSSNVASGPAILTPKEAEKFIDQQPLFQGTASPYAIVVITIESTQDIQTSVEADNLGNWQFRPATPLSPGEHTITIHALDILGVQQTIKRSFTVFAQGSQFTEPSVSPTFEPTPTASASSTPTPTKPAPTIAPTPVSPPTVTPVLTLTPSIIPTPVVLQTITPIVTITPTSPPASPISPPGSSLFLIGGALAAFSITAGFMLFFLL